LPEIEEDEPSEYIKYTKFEPYMLKVLKEREYDPDDSETLLAAFKLLDPEGKGYIEVDMMKTFLEKEGIEFRGAETDSFVKFATNNKQEKEGEGKYIYYEDYISRL
jgi:Ca2+-binding EF-hand superfamily protein